MFCLMGSYIASILAKLDGVGPVENKPSNDQAHHFALEKIIYIYMNIYISHVTPDT